MALNNLKSVFPGSRRIAGSGRELGASARSPDAGRGRATPHFGAHVGRMHTPHPPTPAIGMSAERTTHRLSQVAGGGGAGTTLGPLEGKARRSEESRGKFTSPSSGEGGLSAREGLGVSSGVRASSPRTGTSLRDGVPASPLVLRWGQGLMTVPSTFGVGVVVLFPEELYFPVTSVK